MLSHPTPSPSCFLLWPRPVPSPLQVSPELQPALPQQVCSVGVAAMLGGPASLHWLSFVVLLREPQWGLKTVAGVAFGSGPALEAAGPVGSEQEDLLFV